MAVALLIAACDDFAPPFPGLSPQFQACELRSRGVPPVRRV